MDFGGEDFQIRELSRDCLDSVRRREEIQQDYVFRLYPVLHQNSNRFRYRLTYIDRACRCNQIIEGIEALASNLGRFHQFLIDW